MYHLARTLGEGGKKTFPNSTGERLKMKDFKTFFV
jgi:hypothetical protein